MTTGKPTPTPWAQWAEHAEIYAGDIRTNHARAITAGKSLRRVADCAVEERDEDGNDNAIDVANAALIVRAVNEREGLIAALERAEAPHARGCSRPRNDPSALCSCGLDAILAAAKAP